MYAIIADGGRQLKVEQGQELAIDFRDLSPGDKVTFDQVLAVSDGEGNVQIGAPTLGGATVTAEVVGALQGPKLTVQKFRRRKNSRRLTGHRSMYTQIRIEKIAS